MALSRNIADFYNEIQNAGGPRYGYQFLVKLAFDQQMFDPANRGQYSAVDNVLLAQLGFNLETLGELVVPNPQQIKNDLTFFAQSTSLPKTSITNVHVDYLAQGFEFPGLINYDKNWTIKIFYDSQLSIYRELRLWQEMMSSIARNNGGNKTIPNVRADVQFLDNYGEEITRRYFIEGIYPTDVPEIQMNYAEGSSNIRDGNVTFAMQYFREVDPNAPTSDLMAEYFT